MTPGQAAYEAWRTRTIAAMAVGGEESFLAKWKGLPESAMQAWEEIAQAAIDVWHHRMPTLEDGLKGIRYVD